MSNVVALGRMASTGEPVEDVVRDLKVLLARAERGEILGFAYGYVDGAGFACTGWQTGAAHSAVLVSSIDLVHHKMLVAWSDYAPTPTIDPPDEPA